MRFLLIVLLQSCTQTAIHYTHELLKPLRIITTSHHIVLLPTSLVQESDEVLLLLRKRVLGRRFVGLTHVSCTVYRSMKSLLSHAVFFQGNILIQFRRFFTHEGQKNFPTRFSPYQRQNKFSTRLFQLKRDGKYLQSGFHLTRDRICFHRGFHLKHEAFTSRDTGNVFQRGFHLTRVVTEAFTSRVMGYVFNEVFTSRDTGKVLTRLSPHETREMFFNEAFT